MAGSKPSVGGSVNNSVIVDILEAGADVVNQKYPPWAHATTVSTDLAGHGCNKFRCHFFTVSSKLQANFLTVFMLMCYVYIKL